MFKGRAVGQVDKEDGGAGTKLRQRRQCDARLADAPRTDDRDEPVPLHAFHHFGDARLAADQPVDRQWQRKWADFRRLRYLFRVFVYRVDANVGAQPIAAAWHIDDLGVAIRPGPQRATDRRDVHAQIVLLDEDVRPDAIGNFLH